jgi:hypothetical protein
MRDNVDIHNILVIRVFGAIVPRAPSTAINQKEKQQEIQHFLLKIPQIKKHLTATKTKSQHSDQSKVH